MSLKDTWIDKVDNQDYILAKDINDLAHAIVGLEEQIDEMNSVPIYDGEVEVV